MIKLKDRRQIEALSSLLEEHTAEDRIDLSETARGEVTLAAVNTNGKAACFHYVHPDGCIKTAWDNAEEDDDAEET